MDRQIPLLLLVGALTAVLWACTQPPAAAVSSPVPTAAVSAMIVPPTAVPPTRATLDQVELPQLDWGAVAGNVSVVGSSTVYPLSQHMGEQFRAAGFAGQVAVQSVGTGAGFEAFCVRGEGDVVNASRPIKLSELQS